MKQLAPGITVARMRRPPRGGRGLKRVLGAVETTAGMSPPTRGAWIETAKLSACTLTAAVAPHAGGVD